MKSGLWNVKYFLLQVISSMMFCQVFCYDIIGLSGIQRYQLFPTVFIENG